MASSWLVMVAMKIRVLHSDHKGRGGPGVEEGQTPKARPGGSRPRLPLGR